MELAAPVSDQTASFHMSYASTLRWSGVASFAFTASYEIPQLSVLILLYLYALIVLAHASTPRRAFYGGLLAGVGSYAPQLWFFFNIFHFAAPVLWLLLAIWVGIFVLMIRSLQHLHHVPRWLVAILLPFLWTGLEYFRSELYYLKFAWLTPGIAIADEDSPLAAIVRCLGTYGAGFLLMTIASLFYFLPSKHQFLTTLAFLMAFATFEVLQVPGFAKGGSTSEHFVAIQLEGPTPTQILANLDRAVTLYPDAEMFLLSEYSLATPPPAEIRQWCMLHEKYLLIGGIQPDPTDPKLWADTAFVINPTGDVVFSQAKSVPIQFMADGTPAKEQRLWESPWGKIGICICYDLSYTRVTDELIRQGATLLIVPAMDAAEWGAREHQFHARIAPLRALEYGVPILRVASSGISQSVSALGTTRDSASFPGQGEILDAFIHESALLHPRLPPDRRLAPFCVIITAMLASALLTRAFANRFKK